jgi:hypothetical protein
LTPGLTTGNIIPVDVGIDFFDYHHVSFFGEVLIMRGHTNIGMTHAALGVFKRYAGFQHEGGMKMAEIMKTNYCYKNCLLV